jgi:nucleoside 2-deoxyribosyltransferase
MKGKKLIYLSGPMRDTTEYECLSWRQQLIKKYSFAFDFLDPTRHMQPASPTLIEQDKRDIDLSDAIIANVWKYSSGTLMEVFFAFTSGKTVVVVAPQEFHDDVWLRYHCHFMTASLDDAMDFLTKKKLIA